MSITGDNECSLEQNGEMKSEQFASDSNTDRRDHYRLQLALQLHVLSEHITTKVVSLIPDHGEVYFM